MAEYIEREALIEKLRTMPIPKQAGSANTWLDNCAVGVNAAIWEVASFPTADVAPVVYGRWIRPHWKNNNYCCDCSECGGEAMHRDYQWDKNGVYPICPNCGAKMDGGADHEDD